MAEKFTRPVDGFRFRFLGMKLNTPADALPDEKYAAAVNIRAYGDNSIRTRPGQKLKFAVGPNTINAIHAYTPLSLNSDAANPPRLLAVDSGPFVWLDNGTEVGFLNGVVGRNVGVSMVPFRPNESPSPWMYIASDEDYQKFSTPDPITGLVTQRKVGIAEPQTPPSAYVNPQAFTELQAPGGQWSTGGTASGWTPSVRSTDAITAALPDPLTAALPFSRWSLQVSSTVSYQRGEILNIGPPTIFASTAIIEDVLPPLAISMTVQSIYYFNTPANTGRCIIAPMGVNATAGQGVAESAPPAGVNLAKQNVLANLQRGSLIRIGAELCYVWSVIPGPNQQIAIETSTVGTHIAGESIIGVTAIVVNGLTSAQVTPGLVVQGDPNGTESFAVAVGTGTLTMGNAGGTGNVVARPTTLLNGWGPNAHVGYYEHGVNQGYFFGTDPGTTQPYSNPQLAYDANLVTAASVAFTGTHQYAGCVWVFSSIPPGSVGLALNINSGVPVVAGPARSASIFYSLDGGTTWTLVYDAAVRATQWDTIPLPSSQNLSLVQVMAFTDSHDDMSHQVFEINVTSSPISPNINENTGVYSEDDYLHFSVLADNPLNLLQLQLQIDVGDGSFTQNYYYYSVSPSQLIPASANTVTQIAAVQAILQQEQIVDETNGTGLTSAAPTVAGANQWTEVWIPISGLTRVGGDQTKTLASIVGIQFLVNTLGTINLKISSLAFVGGGTPDIGDAGAPLRYRFRPRDSRTGALGNPSPETRYGVLPRRQPVIVIVPTSPAAAYDPQIDTWDVERYGGAVTSWRRVGSITGFSTTFFDNYDDSALQAGEALDFDNFEPWPSIDMPLNATATQVTGTVALVTVPVGTNQANVLNYLPGNLVNLGGQNVYTLRKRPTFILGQNYLFEFEENAGTATNLTATIYEPEVANQPLPYLWGPDVEGTIFGCGDPLRPGTLYFSKNNNPDSAPDSYNVEIVQPSEPLLGGEILDGLAFVASPERWWALYPQPQNAAQRYSFVQTPDTRGLAAPFGHCNDGRSRYWWAKDGIYSSSQGSLTDADLYTLFPHDGLPGKAHTYGPATFEPPDYGRAALFRLTYAQGYLYATYLDIAGVYHTLVCELRNMAWSLDAYSPAVTAFYHPETVGGTLVSPITVTPTVYNQLYMGTLPNPDANVVVQQDLTNDIDGIITGILATREYDGGDLRAGEQWGDVYMDTVPAAQGLTGGVAGVSIMGMSLGIVVSAFNPPIGPQSTRLQGPTELVVDLLSDFLGILLTWTDDYTKQTVATKFNVWQPSYLIKPETTGLRVTDWDDGGLEGAKWVQGFVLHADTFGKIVPIVVQDAETLATHAYTGPATPNPNVVQHSGESELAYSFNQPFIAHMMRLRPTVFGLPIRIWEVRWIVEQTPEFAQTWTTQPTTHGLRGFLHVRQLSLTYASMTAAELTIGVYDGTAPAPIPLPATGGAVQKLVLTPTFNKAQLFTYSIEAAEGPAASGFQIYLNLCEVLVGQWGREDSYMNRPLVGEVGGDKAEI